eukprot:Seg282.7 transcript_id=Seg282.7/GoldUCD/mRNA.D3Y31 product="Protein ABHD14A" protein_id=Seg282.7/GoldUCD/D3Y31
MLYPRPKLKRLLSYISIGCILLFVFYFGRMIGESIRGEYLEVKLPDTSPIGVYYKVYQPKLWSGSGKGSGNTVVLLFDNSMNTKTWEDVGTPAILKQNGHRVILIYLPQLHENAVPNGPLYPLKGAILLDIMEKLNLRGSVLVSPSKTGTSALPVVLRSGFPIKAFVAIVPSDTDQFTNKEYRILQTKTLIIYGSNDHEIGTLAALETLKQLPNSMVIEMGHAGHFCYVDRTNQFHSLLLKYLEGL